MSRKLPDSPDGQDLQGQVLWRRSTAIATSLVCAFFLCAAWNYRWLSDDGFITLRVVDQITDGNGPVFNVGERVEASTSPLWTWLLALLDMVVPLRLEWIAVLVGIAFSVAGLCLAMVASARMVRAREHDVVVVPAGALVLAALPAMWLNASMGLENGLVFFWLGGCAWLMASWAAGGGQLGLGAAAVIGLGTLVRPELGLVTIVLLAVVVAIERDFTIRRLGLLAASAFAAPIAYEIFRAGYYGVLVSNTALAKEASGAYWSSGWTYFTETASPYHLWHPLVALAAAAGIPLVRQWRFEDRNREVASAAAFVASAVLCALFVVRVGGDLYHARLLMPALFLLLVPVLMVRWERRYAGVLLVVPWVILAVGWLRVPGLEPRALLTPRNPVEVEDYGAAFGGIPPPWFTGEGIHVEQDHLDDEPAPGRSPTAVQLGVGSIGYALGTDTHVFDRLGLGDPVASRMLLAERESRVGHEKPLPLPWMPALLV
jgi:arabinofuranosyltransferase